MIVLEELSCPSSINCYLQTSESLAVGVLKMYDMLCISWTNISRLLNQIALL